MSGRAVLWDFDGTLATRPGHWGACLVEVLDAREPGHGLTRGDLAPFLHTGFPWHDHDQPHPHLSDPDAWWQHIGHTLLGVLTSAKVPAVRAADHLRHFRGTYLDTARWSVYPDSAAALALVAAAGWRNVIVSNHAPELADLVSGLDLGAHVDEVITSARCGYEKPHPAIFDLARQAAGHPDTVWMVGDNPIADIAGAARAGIPGVLVRTSTADEKFAAMLERSYGRRGWPDWRQYCAVTAPTAEAAARRVLAASPNGGNSATR
ncbi:MAG TPA: HAD family hydrolase [Streptosporangiaceae bacterium]